MTSELSDKIVIEELLISEVDQGDFAIKSRGKLVLERFLSNKLGLFGVIVIIILFLAAFVLPYFLPFDPTYIDKDYLAKPPSLRHLWGTNLIGQDVLAQTMSGLRKSLIIAFCVAIISTGLAAIVGAIAGYFAGWSDKILTFLVDVTIVVPSILVISVASSKFRYSSYLILVFFLAAFSWQISSKWVRSITHSLRERDYVHAAEFMGESRLRIIMRHILPNMASVLIADVTLNIGVAVLGEAGLSYLGFGVQPPDVSLGTLISDGSESALSYPWMFLGCCGCLMVLILASNLIGDALRDAFDSTATGGNN